MARTTPTVDDRESRALTRRCRRLLGDLAPLHPPPGYASLGLAVLEAVYAVRGHPASVHRVVTEYCAFAGVAPAGLGRPGAEHTARHLRDAIGEAGAERFATEVVHHRQPTGSRNGILKSEACLRAAQALLDSGIERRGDLRKVTRREAARASWTTIPGQRSGGSWCHLLVLAGLDVIEVDDRLRAFVGATIGRRPSREEAVVLLAATHLALERHAPGFERRTFVWWLARALRARN